MRVLLVGNGGREASLAWRLARSPTLTNLTVTAPNPGWPARAELRPATTIEELVTLARHVRADLVVAGPEAPLAAGLSDALEAARIPCFGPRRAAARLESSKAFAKEVLAAADVPTAAALVVDVTKPDQLAKARERCDRGSVVVKADGLAAGKGVYVCPDAQSAHQALDEVAQFGQAAATVLLEDLLEGPEVSLFALCDGKRAVPLPSAQDHKQLLDGGEGPNTGGMGAYAPCPLVGPALGRELCAKVHQPVLDEMARRGTPFHGVLYAGLMMTPDGPRVLEFNVRFGDPECQALMALWDEDVLPWLHGAATGALPWGMPRFSDASACCVVLASAGYPASSDKGTVIPEPAPTDGVLVFHAGARRDADGVLRTDGGRVLGITGVGPDLRTARDLAYAAVQGWRFEGAQLRSDIGADALR